MAENNNDFFSVPSIEQVAQSVKPIAREENLQAHTLASSVKPSESPESLKDNTQEVEGNDSQETTSDSPIETPEKPELDRKMIYAMSMLIGLGYEFADLEINRAIDENAKKKKKASIKASKGVISPCLVVMAKTCLDAGLEFNLEDGSKVTSSTSRLDRILVTLDGKHREAAIQELNAKLKEGEQKYENYYYFPQNADADIITMLRECNVATHPWKGSDYLTNLLLLCSDKGVDLSVLHWVKKRQVDCSDTAAWLWATLDKSRVYPKTKIIKATTDIKVLKEIAKIGDFEFGKKMYEGMTSAFDRDFVGLKSAPLWVIDKRQQLISTDITMSNVVEKLMGFFAKVKREEAKSIEKIKGNKEASKDSQIMAALDKLYDQEMN